MQHTRRPLQKSASRRTRELRVITDPARSAEFAGLRYVSCDAPGIRRVRAGRGFAYRDADGKLVRDRAVLARIRALVLPPAWRDVWICARADGHLQAVGRDARGRKQYRYHARWREVRDETKYNRMLRFGELLPRIRAEVERHLGLAGLPREKVLAAVVRLLETTLIRVGNEEYARANRSFGLTTLQNRHVQIHGARVLFTFRGKSGVRHTIPLKDRRLARILQRCRDLPGYELFQYVDADGGLQRIDSADVNAWLREISGEDFTAKDFRTWAGTVQAALALAAMPGEGPEAERRKNVVEVVARVAQRLGNTPAVCRRCYVHPAVIDGYLAGTLDLACAAGGDGLDADEGAVLGFLRARLTGETPAPAA